MNTILLVPTELGAGVTSASLGMVAAFDLKGIKAGFFKPFAQESHSEVDSTTALHQHLFADRQHVQPISYDKVVKYIAKNQMDDLLEEAVKLHREITKHHDVVVVEGLLPVGNDPFVNQLNVALAQALDAKVVLVSKSYLQDPQRTADKVDVQLRTFANRVTGLLLMRARGLSDDKAQIPVAIDPNLRLEKEIADFAQQLQKYNPILGTDKLPILGLVPFSNTLSVPRTLDIASVVDGEWINKGQAEQRRILHTSLIASSIEHELNKFVAGELIISAGGRDDVLLASSDAVNRGVPLAGLILAEHALSSNHILDSQKAHDLPVFQTKLSVLETAQRLANFNNEVPSDDVERAAQVSRFVASHISQQWLVDNTDASNKPRLSPSAFRYELVQNSIAAKKRIVLPEGDEPRTVEAAAICQSRGIAHCILLAKPESVAEVAKARNIELPAGLEIIDPDTIRAKYVEPMVALRKGKLDAMQAEEQLQDTVVLGTMMLALDEVDGLVSGAIHTTANTIRPAFQLIKTAPNYSLVSSVFFMLLPEEVYVYGDCAVNPNPTAEQLAEIAIQSADSAKAFGIDPRIAMISYSTGTSGAGADVEKVAEATRIAQERRPDLLIDGPLQYDAASVESVGRSKAPNSQVAGRANVFIFPDLNTGNTTYKAVQRSANVVSVGPMLQGLNKPVNDLSRGALVDDIVFTIALTAIQAANDNV
ncbi:MULTISPECIES: phosphate acetyltransferase [unclassified Acinetobacter]|uniref:phosphate acetyltransferase n=1 Tax=unclassified Acinetobacter TaxID=196816 RepID=UPI0035BAB9FB